MQLTFNMVSINRSGLISAKLLIDLERFLYFHLRDRRLVNLVPLKLT